jgi:mono/diheme cytochrome c family protein
MFAVALFLSNTARTVRNLVSLLRAKVEAGNRSCEPQEIHHRRKQYLTWTTAAALALLGLFGCNQPLPEANTAAEQLYASRCGQCHRAYAPKLLPAAMWQVQVEMMQAKMLQYHVPPLTEQERDTILSYLSRNAAHD